MDTFQLAMFFVLLVFGNTVQAITGFAGTVLIMPFLMPVVGRETAVPIINLLGLLMSIYMAVREHKDIQWKFLLRAYPTLLIGILAGFYFQSMLNGEIIRKAYGVFIILCVFALIIRNKKQSAKLPFAAGQSLLITSGIIHSVFTSGGPLLVVYAMEKLPDKKQFRATLSAIWVAMNSFLAVNHFFSGIYTLEFIKSSAVLSVAVAAGTVLGYLFYPKVNAAMFTKLSYALLFIAGTYTIIF